MERTERITDEIQIPKSAKANPAVKAMSGTRSMPGPGRSPNPIATSSGTHPYTPARIANHRASPVTTSRTSTGAASTA